MLIKLFLSPIPNICSHMKQIPSFAAGNLGLHDVHQLCDVSFAVLANAAESLQDAEQGLQYL